jgi:hypothetical protein
MCVLSEQWVEVSEKIIEKLKQIESADDKDRLDLVRSLRFVLTALQRSMAGWVQWVNNPDVMTIFSQEELQKMTKELSEMTHSFVKYDLEITKFGAEKGLKASKKDDKRAVKAGRFYV